MADAAKLAADAETLGPIQDVAQDSNARTAVTGIDRSEHKF